MKPSKSDIVKIQVILGTMGFLLEPDGIFGPETNKCFQLLISDLLSVPGPVSFARGIQALYNVQKNSEKPIPEDGLFGPVTKEALNRLYSNAIGLSYEKIERLPNPDLPDFEAKFPRYGTEEFKEYFGSPGTQIVQTTAPYPMKYAFDHSIEIKRIQCHSKVAESLEKIYLEVLQGYGLDEIQRLGLDLFAGCYVFRNMKGSDKLSTHAWGLGVDTDPENNQFRWDGKKAKMNSESYSLWFSIWYKNGWISLGKERDFDYMHTQAPGL